MPTSNRFLSISLSRYLALLILLAFTFGALPLLAADMPTKSAQNEGDVDSNSHDLVQGAHVEGHIAFMHAELMITPDQEQLFQPVADAMREDVRNIQDADAKVGQRRTPGSAIDYLQNRVDFARLRSQGEERFLTAFRPLYNALSDRQKRAADLLLIPNNAD